MFCVAVSALLHPDRPGRTDFVESALPTAPLCNPLQVANLHRCTALPPASSKGHVMAGFPHSLIGLAPFVDVGRRVLVTDTAVIAFDRDGEVILEGWRKTTSPKLWRWPPLPQLPPPLDLPQAQMQLGPCAYRAPSWRPSKPYGPSSPQFSLAPPNTVATAHAPISVRCTARASEHHHGDGCYRAEARNRISIQQQGVLGEGFLHGWMPPI